MDFKGQVIIVTGAGSGIGRAVAKKFAAHGADICICGRNERPLVTLQDEVTQEYNVHCFIQSLDVTDQMAVQKFVEVVHSKFGHIDILVNCAGIVNKKAFFEISIEDWYQMIAVHLHGSFLFSHYVANFMKEQGKGCIINMGSTAAISGGTSGCDYAAAKGGIIAFTKSAGRELAPYGIRMNAIAPGKIKTNMTQFNSKEEEEAFIKKMPIGRLGTPEEIADIILFIASKEAEYIIGEVIIASGGY